MTENLSFGIGQQTRFAVAVAEVSLENSSYCLRTGTGVIQGSLLRWKDSSSAHGVCLGWNKLVTAANPQYSSGEEHVEF